jgi:hypothetical protein
MQRNEYYFYLLHQNLYELSPNIQKESREVYYSGGHNNVFRIPLVEGYAGLLMNVFLCITYEGCQENQKELFL